MLNFRSSGFSAAVVVFLLVLPGIVYADGDAKQRGGLSGLFAKELSKNGSVEITSNPEYCASKKRPLLLSQEMAEILSQAIQYSERIKVKSECRRVAGESKYQDCRFYFHSPNKMEQWSMGFSFLGNPIDGEIKLDSIQCFATP